MPCSDIRTPYIAKKKRAPVFPENVQVKSHSGWIVSFGPLCLPVCVSQDSLPFICSEGQEVAHALFLECTMKEEEMIIEHTLVLFITTPKELNGGEGEPSR